MGPTQEPKDDLQCALPVPGSFITLDNDPHGETHTDSVTSALAVDSPTFDDQDDLSITWLSFLCPLSTRPS